MSDFHYNLSEHLNGCSLTEINNIILNIQQHVIDNHGVDLLDNGNYNTLKFSEIISYIDPSIEVSLKRNGYDFVSARGEGELKSGKLRTPHSYGKSTFHAFAVLDNKDPYDEYILKYMHGSQIVRFIQVIDYDRRKAIHNHLTDLSASWKDQVNTGVKSGKHDAISLDERFVHTLFEDVPVKRFDIFTKEITDSPTGIVQSKGSWSPRYVDYYSA